MERFSLIHFLFHRYGATLGALAVLASVAVFARWNTQTQDLESVWLLQETKSAIQFAEREGVSYLSSGKVQELDAYNTQILKIGDNFKILTEKFRGSEDLQRPLSEIQTSSKNFFLSLNEKIQKKQSRPSRPVNFDLAVDEPKKITENIEAISLKIRRESSSSVSIFGSSLPSAWLALWAGLLFASYALWMYQKLSKIAANEMAKDVSDLKLQSIILDGILNSISEAMIVVDEQGRFTRYNNAAERVVGKTVKSIASEEDAKAFGFFDVETGAPLSLSELPFAKAMQGEQWEDKEFLVRNPQQPQGMYISVSSRYLSGLSGHIHGALVVFRDISRRKATELEWRKARESALETARKKSDFLAAMSHEIRTPMNGVLGMATLLNDTALSAEQGDYVGTIKQSAEALLRLINDILDHSKIEAGMIEFLQKPFDLKALCEAVTELFLPAVEDKNVGLQLQLEGRAEWNFIGDPGRIRQILVNLVGNAVKFTDVGAVTITVAATGKNGKSGAGLKISIADTGPGFNETESEFLFQKYFQTKSGMKYGGTGLGLSICHQLVELMGGKMGLQSVEGQGSTFWFEIQLPETTADQIPAVAEHSFAPIFIGHVLLAEDQVINQRVAVTYLQKLGLTVDVANNGQVASEKALSASYDLIFMDCQMPVMTGYEATKKIRSMQKGAPTPIVALTAEGTSGERTTCLSVGMDDFLTKPLELEKLTEMLHRWLKSGPPVLDLKALAKLKSFVVNNKSLTDALIEDFLKTAPTLLSEMQGAFESKNVEGISQAAHALKSCSATLGATGLAELCQKIEDVEDLEKAAGLLKDLPALIESSSKELQKHSTLVAA